MRDLVAEKFSDKKVAKKYRSLLRRSKNGVLRTVSGLIWQPDEYNLCQVYLALEVLLGVLTEIDSQKQEKTHTWVKESFMKGRNLYIDSKGVLQELVPRPELKSYAVPDEVQSILRLDRYDLWNLKPAQIVTVKADLLMVDPDVLDLIKKVKLCQKLTEQECELVNSPDLFTREDATDEVNHARALTLMLHQRASK